jgi:predicted oxidoreductase (fatty acid repression mutant protein)
MLFSKGSSMCAFITEAEPVAEDIYSILNAQNTFVDLLWKYCEQKFGFIKTINIWLQLVTGVIDAHLQAYNTRYNYVKNDVVADQLVPLMKSVMLNV